MRIPRTFFNLPERASIIGFLILISIGTVLLMSPAATTGNSLGFIDALFTSTSASCVTGLAVADTGTDLTLFGQLVILFLIQAGGLGIMTISTIFIMAAGRRPSLTGRVAIQDTFTHSGEQHMASVLRDVILFALVIEGLGMILMFFYFIQEKDIGQALHISIFHSVSAFCNAGFSLFSDSFSGYCENWFLNIVICVLVILGGLGFLVLSELRRGFPFSRRMWSRLSLHSKLVISSTVILLIVSTVLILAMEWRNTLAPLSVPGRFLASFFQAVSTRTAGFNSLAIGNMANETLFLFILLMLIGACPGSCAGGIKTTTFATLCWLGLAKLRGQERPQIFYRTIPDASVDKAIGVVMVSMFIVVIGTLAILMTELGEVSHAATRGKFLELLFEVASAFGTAGLSTGITGELSNAGKLIITLLMFTGRLGPLVIAIAISRQEAPRYYYAEENIMVG
ncbi:MAG: Trk family potassium uptake protein [Desulfobacterales bacterium]|nr:Trk family potassium uptake protein [Desulfobacterales bacterium]